MLKYKNYSKYVLLLKDYPKKLENFKHFKWIKFRNFLKKKKKRESKLKKGLISLLTIKKSLYFWERKKKKFFSTKLFNILYNNGIKILRSKKNINKNNSQLIKKYLINPLFRINILFWILNWCKTTCEFKHFMFCHKIVVNNKTLKNIIFLKKGDIIGFNNLFSKSLNLKIKSVTPKRILSFLELDIYNNSFIVIKNLSEINLNDFYISINTYYNTIDLKTIN